MILDLTIPTIVITGAWNASIFTPPWLAKHVFGYPVGSEAPVAQMLGVNGEQSRQVFYMKNIGIAVFGNRLEIYSNHTSEAYRASVESVILAILETLPHTPIGAIGVNFRFVENNAPDEALDKLDTHEGVSAHHVILEQQVITKISSIDGFSCAIDRAAEGNTLRVDFNYHYDAFGLSENKAAFLAGIQGRFYEQAKEFMREIYELTEVVPQGHDFQEMNADWGVV